MKFDINDYPGNVAMCVKNFDEAKIFTQYLHSIGKTWLSGRSYLGYVTGFRDPEGWGYNFNVGCHDSIDFYKDEGYALIWFSDFEWGEYENEWTDSEELTDFLMSFVQRR